MHSRTEASTNSGQIPSGETMNFIDLLRQRAVQQPTRQAYTFLVDGQEKQAWLTYGQLDLQARAVAVLLGAMGARDERVLLLYPPGLEYISGFMGCLYGRVVAVPVLPPRFNRKMERILMIAADSEARIVLTTRAILSKMESSWEKASELRSLLWVATDDLDLGQADDWLVPEVDGATLAFLQYTSGSTATPRGVMVTHHNLLYNERLIQAAFQQTKESLILSWLPFYHDMGLIGGVLQPLYLGAKCILMSPYAFLQRPLGWLRAISDYKVTTSGGPDFAYDLCVRKAAQEDCSTLDLSSWTVAFNGSEPIRPETINRFFETFGRFGFKRSSFYPCYGLAEATLLVSGGKRRSQPLVTTIDDEALKDNRVVNVQPGGADGYSLVTGGQIAAGQTVIIVDPESSTRCPADRVGEIWVSGPSVARGYYNRLEETLQTFQSYLADTGQGPFLRTGDLGFIKDGELFVTGRIKDLIIIRGQNYYPQDIEATLQNSSAALRKGCGAVFSIEVDGQQRLAIVQEVIGRRPQNPGAIIESIRQAVSEEHQLPPYSICLIREGSIPRTSSGKIRRRECRTDFLAGKFDILAAWQEPAICESQDSNFFSDALPSDVVAMEKWLASLLGAKLGVAASAIDVSRSIPGYGLDSLAVIELMHSLEARLSVSIAMPRFFQAASLSELARLLFELMEGSSSFPPTSILPQKDGAEFNLSRGQQALYFLHQFVTDAPAYNIAALGIIRNRFDLAALRTAVQILVDRHASLRTNFITTAEGVRQRVAERQEVSFNEVDAVTWTEDELDRRIREEANHRFNLEKDRLLRIALYKRDEGFRLLMVAHHLVVDFWSLGIFIKELGIIYAAQVSGTDAFLPPLAFQFSDYVRWQDELLSEVEGERLWSYWKNRLSGELPTLSLPTDRPRPPVQTYAGDCIRFKVPRETADRLNQLSRLSEATLFNTLAAAFGTLLYRYTGQDDLLLGALTNGRGRLEFKEVVGYFVNPIVIRTNFSDDPTFRSLLAGTRIAALEAFEHQDYPFALLVEKLQRVRDVARPPLVQAMFIYHKAHLPGQEAVARFAISDVGATLSIGGIELESLPLNQGATQFEITLRAAAVADGEIRGMIEYNTDLFDASMIARMIDHFQALLDEITGRPDAPVSDLPMMRTTELVQILSDWNLTGGNYPEGECLHQQCEKQARRTPDAVAVSFGEEQVTYTELNARADQLANHLIKLGVRPETRVGICVGRSIEMIVAMLAILKSGGAYVPLDPDFPAQRLSLMIADSELCAIITMRRISEVLPENAVRTVYLDSHRDLITHESKADPAVTVLPENTAYVIYTSGSTGKPKGVQVEHRNAINFFHAMDRLFGSEPQGRWLAVTSISFDISILELFWTLSRGFHVVVQEEQKRVQRSANLRGDTAENELEFSLFYFASDEREVADDRYRLLFEGAKFADRHGFSAVWTPERHFHPFGGLYPNPSVTGAAIAAITETIGIRAGSVVLPLHNPVRVAEEWSVIDNISKGRVGVSVASGWHADDFVLMPDNYANRKEVMLGHIETVRKLWRGEPVALQGGAGNQLAVKIYPRPVQPELPIWITAAGAPDTFQVAGEIGANLLTHLLGQTIEELSEKIKLYRKSWRQHGHGPGAGHVTLMVHTFVGNDLAEVRAKVKDPFCSYLKSSYGLIKNLLRSLGEGYDPDNLSAEDLDALLSHAYDRYSQSSGLIGTLSTCLETVERIRATDVDEIACLIDFGVEIDSVLESFSLLERLKEQANRKRSNPEEGYSIPAQLTRRAITHLQCTPSTARQLSYDPEFFAAVRCLNKLLIGGEASTPALMQELGTVMTGDIHNMYGPTETTIWSTSDLVKIPAEKITIGRPIANTEIYLLDRKLGPLPVSITGNLYIGGQGVVRGYLNSPGLTAERFVPDKFSQRAGDRLYATGDLARYLPDGRIEFLGRADQQVKLRGHRIELGEIEAALDRHPDILQSAVTLQEDARGDKRLIAYAVFEPETSLTVSAMREFLKDWLPDYLIPSALVRLEAMPLTPNGKIYRKGLPVVEQIKAEGETIPEPPRNRVEEALSWMWAETIGVEEVGIHDDFFEIGGHSILASQLISRLRETFHIELSLRTFFDAPTVAKLAGSITKDDEQAMKVERIAELMMNVINYSDDEVEAKLAGTG
jgi:natural product biosynthesis luciferase-like monooxygenase protein